MSVSARLPIVSAGPAHLDLARCRHWLDEAGRATVSATVGRLIAEVKADLQALVAFGDEVASEMHDVIMGALESVATAIEIELARCP